MKKNYFITLSLSTLLAFGTFSAKAQLKSLDGNQIPVNNLSKSKSTSKAVANCGIDTVQYPLLKATGLSFLSINNATSANALGQYYNAADSITINGFDFYAFKTDTTNGTTISVTTQVYLAGVDSLPTGTALSTQTIIIDTTFGGGALTALKKSIAFPSPVTVTQPYVLVVSNNSATNIGVVSSSYANGDGAMEELSILRIGTTYLKGSDVNVGGSTFDADWLLHPHVTYNLNTDFNLNPDSLYSVPSTINVTNNSTPILNDRMYNLNAAFGLISNTYDFGNGGGAANVQDSAVTYTTLQNYTINLVDTLAQYNGNLCVSNESKVLAVGIPTNVKEISSNEVDFNLYPNPSNGTVIIETSLKNERLFVFGIDGKLVAQKLIVSNKMNLDLTGLPNGVYFIQLKDSVKKLIIK